MSELPEGWVNAAPIEQMIDINRLAIRAISTTLFRYVRQDCSTQ